MPADAGLSGTCIPGCPDRRDHTPVYPDARSPSVIRGRQRARRTCEIERDRLQELTLPLLPGHGVSRLHYAGGNPAQYFRESWLVHTVHAISAGDLPRTFGSAAEF